MAAEHDRPPAPKEDPCPWCGQGAPRVWVTSHEQCSACRMVIATCCEGGRCGPLSR